MPFRAFSRWVGGLLCSPETRAPLCFLRGALLEHGLLAGIICGEPGAPAAGLTAASWEWGLSQRLGGSWTSRGPAFVRGSGRHKGKTFEGGKQGP